MNIRRTIGIAVAVAISAAGIIHAMPDNHHHEHNCIDYSSSSRIYKRFCPKHGEWDMRFSFSCPGCNAPKFY